MQVVQVSLLQFWCNFLLKSAPQLKIAKKNTKTPYYGGSWSFKVINVDITIQLITSAFYDMQHVCT